MKKNLNLYTKVNIKKGDTVIVTSGDDKNKVGKVLRFNRKIGKIKVSEVNLQTHFNKKTQEKEGFIEQKEGWIHISNVMLLDNKTQKPTRVKIKDGKRISLKSGEEIL